MLLHTLDWWPRESDGAGHQTRDRLGYLFPAATLDEAAHTLLSDQQWVLCRQLYDHVLCRQLALGHLTRDGLLGLSVANARLVSHLWPESDRQGLAAVLGAVTDYAMGRRMTKKALASIKTEAQSLLDELDVRGESASVRQSVEAVVAVLRAATQARTDADMARHAVRVLNCVEAAAIYGVPEGRSLGRARGIADARSEIWQGAFLYMELILCGSAARMPA